MTAGTPAIARFSTSGAVPPEPAGRRMRRRHMSEADTSQPLQGRVAIITGGARGQGRSHALELARLGADVAICDLCEDIATIGYPLSTRDELAETAKLVDAAGRRSVSEVV